MIAAVRWLKGAKWPTFYYERFVLLAVVEVPALLLITWASPSMATWVSAVLGLVGAVLSQTARSIASRRAEKAAALGTSGLSRAAIVGFFCAIARNLWVDGCGAWRSFYVANKGDVQS